MTSEKNRLALDYLGMALIDMNLDANDVCEATAKLRSVNTLWNIGLSNNAILGEMNTPYNRLEVHAVETDPKYFPAGLTNDLEQAEARKAAVIGYFGSLSKRTGYSFEPQHGYTGDMAGNISDGKFFIAEGDMVLPKSKIHIKVSLTRSNVGQLLFGQA